MQAALENNVALWGMILCIGADSSASPEAIKRVSAKRRLTKNPAQLGVARGFPWRSRTKRHAVQEFARCYAAVERHLRTVYDHLLAKV
jgi:hypothetical protein